MFNWVDTKLHFLLCTRHHNFHICLFHEIFSPSHTIVGKFSSQFTGLEAMDSSGAHQLEVQLRALNDLSVLTV